MNKAITKEEYINWIVELKHLIHSSQIKASLSVNREMLAMYWDIGQSISQKVEAMKWGSSIVEQLSKDLKKLFPTQKGFSRTNLFYMKKWYEFYANSGVEFKKVQQLVGQIPWGQNIVIISKVKDIEEAIFYLQKTKESDYSRNVLIHHIESGLFERSANATHNFAHTLPQPESDLAHEMLKDPYLFDFLTLEEPYRERELELGLIEHLEKFLLELGVGFSFVGRQYKLEVGENEYYLDLLFYHFKLRCFVVIELKAGEFIPEYAGKLNFYCNVVNKVLKHPKDKPTIGLILCKSKDKLLAEYSLEGIERPIGISQYQLSKALPNELKSSLPTVEEIESELEGIG